MVERTECPPAPPALDFAAVEPYNTNDASQQVVPNYIELMEKMPTFSDSVIDLPYNLYQPEQAAANPDELYPLVVYLHGGSGIGNNGEHLTHRHALPFFASSNSLLTPENRAARPAYIVAPQCNCSFGGNEWSGAGYAPFPLTEQPSQYGQALMDLIEHLRESYQVDPARIYVTGISMGGGGAWDIAARRPDLIAAAVPMSGHPLASSDSEVLVESLVPVWAMQGDGDEVNSDENVAQSVEAVASTGGCAWHTEFPQRENWQDIDPGDAESGNGGDINHTVWMRASMYPELWDWLFSVEQPRAE